LYTLLVLDITKTVDARDKEISVGRKKIFENIVSIILKSCGIIEEKDKLKNENIISYLNIRGCILPSRPNRCTLLGLIHPYVVEYCNGLRDAILVRAQDNLIQTTQ